MVGAGREVTVGLGRDEVLGCASTLVAALVVVELISLCSMCMGLYEPVDQVKCSRPRYKLVTINKKQKAASSGAAILRSIWASNSARDNGRKRKKVKIEKS